MEDTTIRYWACKSSFVLAVFLFFSSTTLSQEKKVTLLFAGDAMQHQAQIDAAKTAKGYDYSSYFKHIKEQIDTVDIAIVNLEVTLAGKPYTGYPSFSAPDEFAKELKNIGFDVFLTANNHILDKGRKGLLQTITKLDSIPIKHLGTYTTKEQRDLRYPMVLIKNGIRIALLNYTYDTNGRKASPPNIVNYIQEDSILKDINIAKQMSPDIIIANMHWGTEYKLTPDKAQTQLADFLINNGVNIIIGSHPHVVQPIDIRKENDSIKNIIVYSLGNFVSNMKAKNTTGGTMVTIGINKVENQPVQITDCTYSLVWVHKPIKDGRIQMELIPIDEYKNEEKGSDYLGKENYDKMINFARTATNTLEKLWEKTTNK